MKPWRGARLGAAALLLAGTVARADAGAAAAAGALHGTRGLLRPSVSTHGTYGESYTFIADLEDGGYLHLALALTNLGPGSTKGLCKAVVVGRDGAVWKASDRVGKDQWRWQGGETEKLTIGSCGAWSSPTDSGVEVSLDGGTVRLAFARPLAVRVPPEATLVLGGEFYRTEILLSRVPATGTLTLPGQPPRPISGAAYADHSRSTVKPRELAHRWVRFRALRGDRDLLLLGREGHDGRFAPAWICEGPDACRRFKAFEAAREGEKAPAFRVALAADDRPLALVSGKLLFRDAPLDDLGLLGNVVAPFVGAPVTYVYRGQLTGDGAPVDGILEVQLDGE